MKPVHQFPFIVYPVLAILGASHPLRAQTAGSLDLGFNPSVNGYTVLTTTVQPDGRILLGGWFSSVNGQPRNNIARISPDGTLESLATFNSSTGTDVPIPVLTLQSDGKVLAGSVYSEINGQPRIGIARLHPDGIVENTSTFNPGTGPNQWINCLAVQADGKILAGGAFTSFNGQVRNGIARLNQNGTVESVVTFSPGTGVSGSLASVRSIAVQDDGKILLGGSFTSVNAQPRNNIARLNADGTLESLSTFNPGAGTNSDSNQFAVRCVAVQADGKILIGGSFTTVDGQPRNRIARLNPDGSLESAATFKSGTGADDTVQSTALQADGKILIAGAFSKVNSQPRNRIARLLADGTVESTTTFNAGTGANPASSPQVASLSLQADGKILLGGDFEIVNDQARSHVARLINDAAVQTVTVPDGSRVEWIRSGAAPEVGQVTFELSTVAVPNWFLLGHGTRVAAGWELSGLNLPANGRIRARGRTSAGSDNGSSGIVETVTKFPPSPEIIVEQPAGTTVTNGGGSDFGSVLAGSNTSLIFTVRNTGNADLTGLAITIDGADAAMFNVISSPVAPVAGSGGTTSFTVQFSPASTGMKTATLQAASNDGDANPVTIILTGTGTDVPAEIGVQQPTGADISDGSSRHFGNVPTDGSAELNFVIKNIGGSDLTGLMAAIDGADAAMFSVTANPAASVNPGGSTSLTVKFTPYAIGIRTGTLHISSNDADENPFDIALTGTGTPAPAGLDVSFGGTGKVTTPGFNARAIALQGDGKIVLGGSAGGEMAAARYRVDGSLDTSFRGTGIAAQAVNYPNGDRQEALSSSASGVAVDSTGSISLVGTAYMRFSSFPQGGGWAYFNAFGSVLFRADGSVSVLTRDGSRDLEFQDECNGAAVTPGGGLGLIGVGSTGKRGAQSDFAIFDHRRITTDFTEDSPYPRDDDYGQSGAVQTNGKLVVAGYSGSPAKIALARYNSDLSLDTGFNGTGKVRNVAGKGFGVAVQSDGRIVVAGGDDGFKMVRYNPDGSLDGSFNNTGVVTTAIGTSSSARGVVVQSDGRIVAAGSSDGDFAVVRYRPNGDIDTSFNGTGIVTTDFGSTSDSVSGVALQTDGKILVVGNSGSNAAVARYLAGGRAQPFPEIAVEQPAGTNLISGSTAAMDFGTVVTGSSRNLTFTIRNEGTGELSGITVTKAATGTPGDFGVGAVSSALGPGATGTFTVTFSPSAPGIRTATLEVASNDANENPFVIHLAGKTATASEAWRQAYFGSPYDTGPGADLEDPEHDGIVNLIEWATTSDPLNSSPPRGQLVKNGGLLEFTYFRPKAATDEVTYVLEWTESLNSTWSTVGGGSIIVLSDDGILQQVKHAIPAGSGGKRFVRLRVRRI